MKSEKRESLKFSLTSLCSVLDAIDASRSERSRVESCRAVCELSHCRYFLLLPMSRMGRMSRFGWESSRSRGLGVLGMRGK